jgi:hypothetical protein
MSEQTSVDIQGEVERRAAEKAAQYVQDAYSQAQRALWMKVKGLKVFDFMEFDASGTGSTIVLHIYADPATRDLKPGQKVLCMAILLFPKKTQVWWTNAIFKVDGLYDEEGGLLIPKLQNGSYTIF